MMTSVIIENVLLFCFLTFYILQVGVPKFCGARGNFLPYPPLDGCVSNALINELKKLMQCVNSLKN